MVKNLFGNIFLERKVSTARLIFFAEDCVERFVKINSNQQLDELIFNIQVPLQKLKTRTGNNFYANYSFDDEVALSKNQFVLLFKKTMTDSEPLIAEATRNSDSSIYKKFFPHGVSEYQKAIKPEIPDLINRIYNVATIYSFLLDADLLMNLQSFKLFLDNNKLTKLQKNVVFTRQKARIDLERALLHLMHTIAIQYLGEVELCSNYFDFNLLFNKSREKKDKVELSEILFKKALLEISKKLKG